MIGDGKGHLDLLPAPPNLYLTVRQYVHGTVGADRGDSKDTRMEGVRRKEDHNDRIGRSVTVG